MNGRTFFCHKDSKSQRTPKSIFCVFLPAFLLFLPWFSFAQQKFETIKISEDANIRSDQRPIPIGFYDIKANKTFVTWMGVKSQSIVKELDHTTNKWSGDKIVGTPTFVDKHN